MIRHYPERSEDMKSFADILRGEGMERDMKEKSKKVIRNLLNDGKDIETIARYTELTIGEVEKIVKEIEK